MLHPVYVFDFFSFFNYLCNKYWMQYILCLSENLYKNFEPMNLKNILIITFVVYLKKNVSLPVTYSL